MFDSHAGYVVASKIDRLLDEVLQVHKITDEANLDGYRSLIRTVKTGISIMEKALPGGSYNEREKAAYDAGVQAGRDEMEIVRTP